MVSNQKIEDLKQAAVDSLKNPGKGKEMPKVKEEIKPILFLFRHTETTDNVGRIFSGRRDPHLTEQGKIQAQELAQKLKNKKIDLFISPPLYRCSETLEPLLSYFPNIPYLKKEELVERDYGQLTGLNKLEMMEKYPQEAVLWRRSWDVAPPKGESIKQVWESRIKKFCIWLKEKIKEEKINVAYCGTNNTVRLIRMYFEKITNEEMLTLENSFGDYASYSFF